MIGIDEQYSGYKNDKQTFIILQIKDNNQYKAGQKSVVAVIPDRTKKERKRN